MPLSTYEWELLPQASCLRMHRLLDIPNGPEPWGRPCAATCFSRTSCCPPEPLLEAIRAHEDHGSSAHRRCGNRASTIDNRGALPPSRSLLRLPGLHSSPELGTVTPPSRCREKWSSLTIEQTAGPVRSVGAGSLFPASGLAEPESWRLGRSCWKHRVPGILVPPGRADHPGGAEPCRRPRR